MFDAIVFIPVSGQMKRTITKQIFFHRSFMLCPVNFCKCAFSGVGVADGRRHVPEKYHYLPDKALKPSVIIT
jgi:hypothetical protein